MDDEDAGGGETERIIGHGGFATVFILKNHNPPAVVKYLHLEDERAENSFKKEAALLERLTHPNIVRFYGTREHQGLFGMKMGIVMEFCGRRSISQTIFNQEIVYHMHTVISWAQQLYGALHYLQIRNFVHRDISSNNILLTDNFIAKIGDFGCMKEERGTCMGTKIGTPRYMSPPKRYPIQTSLITCKNDVYSLGLVLWESIQRKVVLSEYGSKHFQYEEFLKDFYSKKITEIPSVECPNDVDQILKRCLLFDHSTRPTSQEAFEAFQSILNTYEDQLITRSRDSFLNLAYQPQFVEKQSELIKPIGFDGTDQWIPVESLPKGLTISNIVISYGEEEMEDMADTSDLYDEDSLTVVEMIDQGRKEYEWDLKAQLARKFDSLQLEERREFLARAMKIFNELQQTPIIYEEPYIIGYLPSHDLESEPIDTIFQALLENARKSQIRLYQAFFIHVVMLSKTSFSFWTTYQAVFDHDRMLENVRKGYPRKVVLRSYFSMSTKEDWLLLRVDESRRRSTFVSKDFSRVYHYIGEWLNGREKAILVRERYNEPVRLEVVDSHYDVIEMEFTHLELIDVHLLSTLLDKHRQLVEKAMLSQMKSLIPIDDSMKISYLTKDAIDLKMPCFLPGYVFQLRNPPRPVCHCSTKCQLKSQFGLVGIFSFDVPIKLHTITWYSCTVGPGYQEFFVRFCEQFNRNFLELVMDDADSDNGYRVPLKSLKIEKNLRKRFHRNYFIFLLYPKDGESINEYLILLDYPDNYRNGERILAFDYNWKLYSLEVIRVREYFEKLEKKERQFIVIDSDMKAWDFECVLESIRERRGNPIDPFGWP